MTAAPLYEVFSSIQGEASRVGERHLFVRLAGCDLECAFCDTPASRRIPGRARLHLPDGAEERKNPLERDALDDWVERLDHAAGPHHAIAVTGGEPLLFVDYLRPLLERWRARGHAILLETAGHRPDDLERILSCIDIVMADFKIASSAGFVVDAAEAMRFVALAARKECAIKVVVSAATTPDEVRGAARIVPEEVPLILQPVSGARFGPPSGRHLLALQREAIEVHRRTRVIPQTHRSLHVR